MILMKYQALFGPLKQQSDFKIVFICKPKFFSLKCEKNVGDLSTNPSRVLSVSNNLNPDQAQYFAGAFWVKHFEKVISR